MIRCLAGAMVLAIATISGSAQSLDDLNIQIHGYVTEGFLYTTQNNIFTTNSSNGSPAWAEAVLNVTSQPTPKLRIGVQGRYFLLGNFGDTISLDWASVDYKFNERIGVRFGKVKTPQGLYNEIQDIDPAYVWSLLPQGVYPLTSRESLLTHYGGVVYGTLAPAKRLGKFEYRGWGGEQVVPNADGDYVDQSESGINLAHSLNTVLFGATLRWKPPLRGFLFGASDSRFQAAQVPLVLNSGGPNQTQFYSPYDNLYYFGQYDKNKFMFSAEWERQTGTSSLSIPGQALDTTPFDTRGWYGMTTYKLSGKLTAGVYDSQFFDHQAPLGPDRYQKDWDIAARYDFNQYLYAKAEQHFIEGTALGYDNALNPNGLKTNTRLSILKIGVSF